MKCNCPIPVIGIIEALQCFENIGQIKKLIFQRAGYQFVAGVNDFNLAASYTPLFAAANSDDTRMVITPSVTNFIIPKTTAISETIDNELKVVDGSEAVATGMARKWPSNIIQQVRQLLMCEPDLVFFAVNKDGQLVGREVSDAPQVIEGIPIKVESGFVGDSGDDSKSTVAQAEISFALAYQWRDGLVIQDPEAGFRPLVDLKSEII